MVSSYIFELSKTAKDGTRKQDFSYYELIDRCKRYKIYDMDESEYFAYMVGNVLGSSELYKQICMESDLQAYEEKVLSPNSMQFKTLKIISESPGISRKELLEKLPGERTSSAVSHLTGILKDEKYITYQKVGQEKRFFATPRGDEYVRTIQENTVLKAGEEQSATAEPNLKNDIEITKRRQANVYIVPENNNSYQISPYYDQPDNHSKLAFNRERSENLAYVRNF